jgi:hypothetical protein
MGHPKAKEVFMKRLRITLLSFIAALLVASCATGPLFVEEPTIPDGQALVYIYRPYTLYGSAIKQVIMSNGGPVVKIAADGYYPYFSSPGILKFWVGLDTSNWITVNAVADQKYYIRVNTGALSYTLTLVPPETAKAEIAKCKLVE